jgi:hypothetical protein
MPPAGLELAIPTNEQSQTLALDCLAIGKGEMLLNTARTFVSTDVIFAYPSIFQPFHHLPIHSSIQPYIQTSILLFVSLPVCLHVC